MTTIAIKNMSAQEKLALMEDLWASFDDKEELDSPLWHNDVLEARMQSIKEGTAEYISLESLRNEK